MKPIIAQAPMGGVSDAAYRFITDKYGKPEMLFTEFVPAEGIAHGGKKLLNTLIHHKTHTTTVAQLYGVDPDSFYQASLFILNMGFDGIDINMGCPDKNVSKRGAGAGLILQPKLAKKIIISVKKAVSDFQKKSDKTDKKITVSVKTRTGFDQPITKKWISQLIETEIDMITLHGRTLKQMYKGEADWEEIGKGAKLTKQTQTLIIGNGDIKSQKDALDKINIYNLDGAMIGRASLGNPWVFCGYQPTIQERIQVAIEHCEAFIRLTPQLYFPSLRKHLAWYIKDIKNANQIRNELMTVNNFDDVQRILSRILL